MQDRPLIGVIGGSGVYKMDALKDIETVELSTPFGKPSSPIFIGTLSGKRVAFLARHGIGHFILPSEVNYRANIYALKSIGVKQVISISACGSLREDYAPGHIVIPDNLFDFTKGKRKQTFFGKGIVAHIGSADPYCVTLSDQLYNAVVESGATAHKGGTFITVEGPRFSTKAESLLYKTWGMSIIGMTACPEAFLAIEAELCYATMAHVTDYDVWHEEPVSVEIVIRTLHQNNVYAQKSLELLVAKLDLKHSCDDSLKNAIMTDPSIMPEKTKSELDLLINKYIAQG